MYKISKPVFISISIILLVILIIFFSLHSNTATFNEAHQDAKHRIKHIQKEIEHAQNILVQTKVQLDSVEENVNALKTEQANNAIAVRKSKHAMDNTLSVQEEKLEYLQNEYRAIQNEKRQLELHLDSIANNLQHNF
jgi:septal ring factor EnvC (AmiA/AmiB activator)